MKAQLLRSVLMLIVLLHGSAGFSQVPQKMSYQAVIRDNNNVLVSNSPVGMRVSIIQGASSNPSIYTEIYNPNPQTNVNGLLTLQIGGGIPTVGSFASIDWSNGPYFLLTEVDPTGGTNYSIFSNNQLLSVPFALYAATSGGGEPGPTGPTGPQGPQGPIGPAGPPNGSTILNGTSDPLTTTGNDNDFYINTTTGQFFGPKTAGEWGVGTSMRGYDGPAGATGMQGPKGDKGDQGAQGVAGPAGVAGPTGAQGAQGPAGSGGFTHYIGEFFGGGIVFYVYKTNNVEHGLVASLSDLSGSAAWGLSGTNVANCESTWNGNTNTLAFIGQGGSASDAPGLCDAYSNGTFTDWYLPSIDELTALYNARFLVNKALWSDGNGSTIELGSGGYWSSTEVDAATSRAFDFGAGYSGPSVTKSSVNAVRAVRAF